MTGKYAYAIVGCIAIAWSKLSYAHKNPGIVLEEPKNGKILVVGRAVHVLGKLTRIPSDTGNVLRVLLWSAKNRRENYVIYEGTLKPGEERIDLSVPIPDTLQDGDYFRLEARYLPFFNKGKGGEKVAYGFASAVCLREFKDSTRICIERIH